MSNIFSLSIIFVILLYPLIFSTITSIILLWTFFLEHSITRVELLQKQQITSLDRFRQQAKELKVTVGKDLEEASVDSAGMFFAELYCTVLYCAVLWCTILQSPARYDTILYDTVLFCFLWYQAEVYWSATHCILSSTGFVGLEDHSSARLSSVVPCFCSGTKVHILVLSPSFLSTIFTPFRSETITEDKKSGASTDEGTSRNNIRSKEWDRTIFYGSS